MLTPAQKKALDHIEAAILRDGFAPSIRELADALGHKCHGSAARLVLHLEERGHIRRLPHRARAIEIVRRPIEQAFIFDDTTKSLVPLTNTARS